MLEKDRELDELLSDIKKEYFNEEPAAEPDREEINLFSESECAEEVGEPLPEVVEAADVPAEELAAAEEQLAAASEPAVEPAQAAAPAEEEKEYASPVASLSAELSALLRGVQDDDELDTELATPVDELPVVDVEAISAEEITDDEQEITGEAEDDAFASEEEDEGEEPAAEEESEGADEETGEDEPEADEEEDDAFILPEEGEYNGDDEDEPKKERKPFKLPQLKKPTLPKLSLPKITMPKALANIKLPQLKKPSEAGEEEDGQPIYVSVLHDVVILLVAVTLIFTFVIRIVGVKGASMEPTYLEKDRLLLLCNTISHTYEPGDVVVLIAENYDPELPLIKRVIATEGQTVKIDFEAGTVTVDGKELKEDYIAQLTHYDAGGMKYPITVPEGCVFVMGDNRNRSTDSRDARVGFISTDDIIGKVFLRIWPLGSRGADK